MPKKITKTSETIQQASTEKQPLRVAAYCRVSTKHEEQQRSLEAQIDHYTRYIQNHPGWVLVGVYSENFCQG